LDRRMISATKEGFSEALGWIVEGIIRAISRQP
jgi:hypothetical protein